MLPLCVSQLKVLREHQVNIHWLASTVRNLINMSSGCLLTVSFNALPTHTPTHMNEAQVHTHTHACCTDKHTWNTHANAHTKKYACAHTHARTHTPTRYLANLAEDLSRQAAPTGWAKISLKLSNLSHHINNWIRADRQAGWLPVQLNKSWLVKWTCNEKEVSLPWLGDSFDGLCRKCLENVVNNFQSLLSACLFNLSSDALRMSTDKRKGLRYKQGEEKEFSRQRESDERWYQVERWEVILEHDHYQGLLFSMLTILFF